MCSYEMEVRVEHNWPNITDGSQEIVEESASGSPIER